MKDEEVVANVFLGGQEIVVIKVPGIKGYKFEPIFKEGLPIAAELARIQHERGIPYIERVILGEEIEE